MSFFRFSLLAAGALLAATFSAAHAAVSLTEPQITNVGTTTFTVVWTTSEVSTPGLEVYADAAGTNALTASLGLEYYPIAEGDPAVVNNAQARAGRRALETLAINRGVVSVRVTGLAPGTTYHVRPRTFDASGADNGTGLLPLKPATTAQFTSMVADARVLKIRIPTFPAEGMILLVQGPAGITPLSAIVGDSGAADVALVSTAHLIDTTTGTNALFTTPQAFQIKAIGIGAPTNAFTHTIAFSGGFGAANSEPIEANIESPAPLFTTPPANQTVAAGATATFTVAATGKPAPTFQWQRKPAGSATWSPLANNATYAGVTTSTLTVITTAGMTGDQFRALATNGVPPDAISAVATLTVTATSVAPTITTPPESTSVIAGTTAHFDVVATGTPAPTFQWQRLPAGSATWADLTENLTYAGVASAQLAIANTALAMNGDQFRVVVSNGVLPNVTSAPVTLTVSTVPVAPAIIAQPSPQIIAAGTTATFAAAASGTPTPTLRWQIRLAGSGGWLDLTDTPPYAGTATGTLTVSNTTLPMSGDAFRLVATNGVQPDAASDAAALTVLAGPTIATQPQPVSVAAGAAAQFAVGASGTDTLTYLWQRRAAGSDTWLDLENGATYTGATTATLSIASTLIAMSGDQFRVLVTDTVGTTTSDPATLSVTKAPAVIALSNLKQAYTGSARAVSAVTTPAGLTVKVTYNGSATVPVYPGAYAVEAQIDEPGYVGTATGELVVVTTNIVRKAPVIDGGLDGSLQVVNAESISLKGWISGDLLVPGNPSLVTNGSATLGGTRESTGPVDPSSHTVTLETTAALRFLVRRVTPVTLPVVAPPPAPTGTRSVTLSNPSQNAGDFTTLRNLNVTGTAGQIVVPPGTYGNFVVNGSNNAFVLGVAGATEPAVYNFQNLAINSMLGTSRLVIVGPVVITVATGASLFGNSGTPDHPEWLVVRASGGNVGTNGTAVVHGFVIAPNSQVSVASRSSLRGGVVSDRLTVAATAELKEIQP